MGVMDDGWKVLLIVVGVFAAFIIVMYPIEKFAHWIGAPKCPHCNVNAKYVVKVGDYGAIGWYECPSCHRRAERRNVNQPWYIR